MESKQLHTERHLFGQNYHLNINLQLPLKNLKWKLRNGYVIHVPADYAKNFNQILGLLIRNMVSKNVNLLCFTTIFLKNLEMPSPTRKNYKIIIENVFSQPEISRVINIKCFSENFRTLSNFWCWEFCEIIYWIITVKYRLDVWWDPESVSEFTIRRF